MKKILSIFVLFISFAVYGQYPPERSNPENFPALRVSDSLRIAAFEGSDTLFLVSYPNATKIDTLTITQLRSLVGGGGGGGVQSVTAGTNITVTGTATNPIINSTAVGGNENLAQTLAIGNDAGGVKITGLANPTLAQDAATKAYVDANIGGGGGGGGENLAQTLAIGNDAGGVKITGLANPTLAQDAATKAYVDANIGGGGSGSVNYIFNDLSTLLANSTFTADSFSYAYTLKEGYTYQTAANGGDLQTAGGMHLIALPNSEGWITTDQLNYGAGLTWLQLKGFYDRRGNNPSKLLFTDIYDINITGEDIFTPAGSEISAQFVHQGGLNITAKTSSAENWIVDSNCIVSNIIVTDNGVATSATGGALFTVDGGSDNVLFENFHLSSQYQHQIKVKATCSNTIIRDGYIGDGFWRIYVLQNPGALTTNTIIDNVYFGRGFIVNSEHIKLGSIGGAIRNCTFDQAFRDAIDCTQGLQDFIVENNRFLDNGVGSGFGGFQLKSVTSNPPQPNAYVRNSNVIVRANFFKNSSLEVYSDFQFITNPDYDTLIAYGIHDITINDNVFYTTPDHVTRESELNFMNAYNISGTNNKFINCPNPIQNTGSTNTLVAAENLNLSNTTVIFDSTSTWVMNGFRNCNIHFDLVLAKPQMTTGASLCNFSGNDGLTISGNFIDSSTSTLQLFFVAGGEIILKDLNLTGDVTKDGVRINNTGTITNVLVQNSVFNSLDMGVALAGNSPYPSVKFVGNTGNNITALINPQNTALHQNLGVVSNTGNTRLWNQHPYGVAHVITGNGNGGFPRNQTIDFGIAYFNGDKYITLNPETGTSDALNDLYGGIFYDRVILQATSGNTITVTSVGNINVPSSRSLSGTATLLLELRPDGDWHEVTYTP